jgi:L-cysteine/cystine lyase
MFGELRVTTGPAVGTTLALEGDLFIGRSASGAGALGGDAQLSARHARIVRTPRDTMLLVDMGSEHGTRVNGERATTRELAVGDVVRVGGTTLEVSLANGPHGTGRHRDDEANARAFRAEYPIFDRVLYLNAGMEGPVPARAVMAVEGQLALELRRGRSGAEHWGNLDVLTARLREGYARVLGCDADAVGLTRATTDGVNVVLGGLRFAPGDELVTTDEEHQGVYAPLAATRERTGCRIRVVPFDDIANAVTKGTCLVVCSHVSWRSGRVVDTKALKATGVPFLLDGAQALGAMTFDVRELGCDYYAASGQKWLCGPDRSGCLYVRPDRVADLSPPVTANYFALDDTQRPLELVLAKGARRFDPGNLPGATSLWALAALDVIGEAGLRWVTDRGPRLAGQLATRLREAELEVEPRGASTLVSLRVDDAPRVAETFGAEGIVVRDVQGRVRFSVGAWCLEEDVERVAEVAARVTRKPS